MTTITFLGLIDESEYSNKLQYLGGHSMVEGSNLLEALFPCVAMSMAVPGILRGASLCQKFN